MIIAQEATTVTPKTATNNRYLEKMDTKIEKKGNVTR